MTDYIPIEDECVHVAGRGYCYCQYEIAYDDDNDIIVIHDACDNREVVAQAYQVLGMPVPPHIPGWLVLQNSEELYRQDDPPDLSA